MFARAFGIFCCFCLYCRCYCCCCWCCYFTTAASARCYFPSNSLAKTIWWMLYRTLRKVPGMDTNNMSEYTWWPQHVLLLSFLLWLVLQRENMIRFLSCNLWRFVELCLSESLSSKCTRKEELTAQRNTTVIHVWQPLSKDNNDYTTINQCVINNVRYV